MEDSLDSYYHGHDVTMVSHGNPQTPMAMHINNISLASSSSSMSWNTPLTSPMGTPCGAPPSERGVHLNNLYLESKTEMLGVIEEGLQLKLQIQTIKDQFFQLVNDFGNFEQEEMKRCQRTTDSGNLPPQSLEAIRASGSQMCPSRARVRALYEARKARVRAKVASIHRAGTSGSMDRANVGRSSAEVSECRSPERTLYRAEDDKENLFQPLCRSTPFTAARIRPNSSPSSSSSSSAADTMPPLTEANLQSFSQAPARTMTWSIKKFLTPIKEEHLEQPSLLGFGGGPQGPSSRRGRHRSTPRPKDGAASRSVQQKCPMVDYVNVGEHRLGVGNYCEPLPSHRPEVRQKNVASKSRKSRRKSASSRVPLEESPTCMDIFERLDHRRSNVQRDWSVVGYDTDSSVHQYTGKSGRDVSHRSLKDISQISHVSSPHEQVSSANLTGAFHSTFNYPLHSTMNHPLQSHLNLSDIKPMDQPDTFTSHNDSVIHRRPSDTQTTISEPISHCRGGRDRRGHHAVTPRALDDSYMDYQLYNSQASASHSSRVFQTRKSFSPSSYRTPTKKPQATLCKEHGLHPTFGGPCIFATDNSTLFDDSSCPELDVDENDNTPKAPNQTPTDEDYSKQKLTMTETDCDSSYLSECVDDQNFSQGFSELVITAVHDMESAQRMLRRQTGQAELNHVKAPVGLSESDLLFDMTQKEVSVEATRASMPDFSGLSTMLSTEVEDDDQSESTLHASSPKKSRLGHDSDDFLSPNSTMVTTEPKALSSLSTDDSPASHRGLPVPVNSPNITDSTGSSSRPTTDNYEFIEAPPPTPAELASQTNESSVFEHSISNKKPSLISCLRPSISSKSKSHRSQITHSKFQPMHHKKLEPTPPRKKSKRKSSKLPAHRPASERAPSVSHDARSTGRTVVSCYSRSTRSRPHSSQDWDSGCSVYSSQPRSQQFMISDNTGQHRTIVHHDSMVSRDLPHHRKKALAKKIKHFSNSFYSTKSTGNLELETLAHF